MPLNQPFDLAPLFRPLAEITPTPVEWLWPGRLPLGKLALLEGDPGLGKSFVALDLCARLSTGRPWPDGAPAPGPASAVFLNGEDGAEDTLAPRLTDLGADPDRVFLLDRQDDIALPLVLPSQASILEALVARVHARLVVIDPVMAFFGPTVNTASDQGIRRALAPLADLASRHSCTVLLLRHLNNKGAGRALYRGLGSIGLVGACRSAWLVAEEAPGLSRRVLAQVKNNLAAPQSSLAFEVVGTSTHRSILHWLGPVAVTADSLLALPRSGPKSLPRDLARAFLEEVLADGPRSVRDIWHRAQEAGLSERTLRRAKHDLAVRPVRLRLNGRNATYWLLPEQDLPAALPPETAPPDLEEWLRPLRERYPPATPLDDP
jgi:hypothetical protein